MHRIGPEPPSTEPQRLGRTSFAFRARSGATILVDVPDSEVYWLKALFRANAHPFKALIEMGFELPAEEDIAS